MSLEQFYETYFPFWSVLAEPDRQLLCENTAEKHFDRSQPVHDNMGCTGLFIVRSGPIMFPDMDIEHDLYGVPNVVEVIYSNGREHHTSRVVNDDANSPTSTVARGREIKYQTTDVGLSGIPTNQQVDEYAERLLKELSTVEYTITYTHAYCGTRLGDCVRINYSRAGLTGIKAKIISQTIKCEHGCPVTEKAVFTSKLWR